MHLCIDIIPTLPLPLERATMPGSKTNFYLNNIHQHIIYLISEVISAPRAIPLLSPCLISLALVCFHRGQEPPERPVCLHKLAVGFWHPASSDPCAHCLVQSPSFQEACLIRVAWREQVSTQVGTRHPGLLFARGANEAAVDQLRPCCSELA